jgi:hypothetical protein
MLQIKAQALKLFFVADVKNRQLLGKKRTVRNPKSDGDW